MRFFLPLILAMSAFCQSSVVILPPEHKDVKVEIPAPKAPQLDDKDFRVLADLLLKQQNAWKEYQQHRAEAAEADKKAMEIDQKVLQQLADFRTKYNCQACDLSWQGVWSPAGNLKFAEKK